MSRSEFIISVSCATELLEFSIMTLSPSTQFYTFHHLVENDFSHCYSASTYVYTIFNIGARDARVF